MSTKALLQGLGVGRAEMTTVAATLHWVMKDGASMIGGLLFTTLSSTNFGQNAKSWRLFADYIYNIGITLDLIAPMNQAFFLYFICLSSVCKSLCAVAAGATGSVISEHWGQWHGNVAEVNSKNKAQSMVVSLLCLLVSVPFTRFIDKQSASIVWGVYSVLTAVHTVVSYLCVRSLQLRSVNVARGVLLVKNFLDTIASTVKQSVGLSGNNSNSNSNSNNLFTPAQIQLVSEEVRAQAALFTPSHIASIEPIVFFPSMKMTKFRGKFGTKVPFDDGIVHLFASPSEVHQFLSMTSIDNKNLMNELFDGMSGDNKYTILMSKKEVFVCFSENASNVDQVKALFEACLMLRYPLVPVVSATATTSNNRKERVNQLFELFETRLIEGKWDLKRVMLRPKDVRVFASNNVVTLSSTAEGKKDSISKKVD